jgi:predicted FMN-binding regulatory protein PaiB
MIGGIIGFEMQIESLAGKLKLGQDRSDVDKQGILEHLAPGGAAGAIAVRFLGELLQTVQHQ